MMLEFVVIVITIIVFWLESELPWQVKTFAAIWFLLFAALVVTIEKQLHNALILRLLRRRDSAGLYTLIMKRLLGWLPRALLPRTAQDTPLPEKGFGGRLMWHLTPMARDGDDLRRLQSNPFSWPVLDAAMKIALIYPVFFALCQWVWTGADTALSEVVLFPVGPHWWLRAVAICLVIALILSHIWAATIPSNYREIALLLLFWFVATITAATVGAGAGGLAIATAIAVAFAFAGATAAAAAIAAATAGIAAITALGAISAATTAATSTIVTMRFTINPFTQRQRGVLGYGLFIAALCLILIISIWAAIALGPSGTMSDGVKTLLLFLALFPMINAIFDYLSYGITISLLKRGFAAKNVWTGIYGLVDVVAAGVMFLLLSVTLVLAVAGLNRLTGQTWLDLPALFTGLETAPAAHLWVMGMIFSTLVPTVIHLIIALFSAIMWVPQKFWAGLADKIAKHHQSGLQFIGAAAVVSTIYAVYFWGITIGLFIAGQWVWQWHDPVGQGYLRLVRTIAETLGVL